MGIPRVFGQIPGNPVDQSSWHIKLTITSVHGHLGCFQIFAVTNDAEVNNLAYISYHKCAGVSICSNSPKHYWVKANDSDRNCHIAVHEIYFNLQSHQLTKWLFPYSPISNYIIKLWETFTSWTLPHYVALIRIALYMNEVAHVSIHLRATCMSFFVNFLFMAFVQFLLGCWTFFNFQDSLNIKGLSLLWFRLQTFSLTLSVVFCASVAFT